ncbi:MAG: hypothetical protein M1816_006233 [Peltula sp. TS41687]|nr:MAG: hypothetical protein M1816_006233 [Peltula sp. TS41687]
MAEQTSLSSILAALAAQHAGAAPAQATYQAAPSVPQPAISQAYPSSLLVSTPPANLTSFSLPQPSSSGSLDLSNIKPVNSGTVSIAEAIAKAKSFAAEKGVSYEGRGVSAREPDSKLSGRPSQRSRSRSRSPPVRRDNFRDNHNPYRDDRRGTNGRDHTRDRSYSPGPRDRRGAGKPYSPPTPRGQAARGDRSPADDNVETIQIDSSFVGLIIGRQGENLRRVENETGARVQFVTGPEVSGPSRTCKLSGSRQARMDAKKEIHRIIDENGKPALPQPDRGNRGSSHQPVLREGEDTIQIMVPDRTVGLIIGRGGETIRDLQERSKCHVNIVSESKSINGLRPVNLIGSPQAAAKAKELIMEIVDSDTKSLANQLQMQRETGRDTTTQAGYSAGTTGSYGGNDRLSESIRVPSEAVGMIIGKGGDTIKELQATTGCKINVTQHSGPNEVDREIGLVGTKEAIQLAKNAIEEKVNFVRRGKRGQQAGSYNERDTQETEAQAPYGQNQSQVTQAPGTSSQSSDADPYAAYGGYQNYVAMWYQMVAQQQQQAQGQGEQPKPPGTS